MMVCVRVKRMSGLNPVQKAPSRCRKECGRASPCRARGTFGVTATFYVEFQAFALLHLEIDRQGAVLLPERQDFRIGQEPCRIVRRHFVWRLAPLSGEGRARLRGKPDHRFRKNSGRPLKAGLLARTSKMALANWASIRRRSKRLCAIDKPSGRSKSAIA